MTNNKTQCQDSLRQFDIFLGKLFGGTVMPNKTLFGKTVSPTSSLFDKTPDKD